MRNSAVNEAVRIDSAQIDLSSLDLIVRTSMFYVFKAHICEAYVDKAEAAFAVAIKFANLEELKNSQAADVIKRGNKILRRLNHPNIVKVYEHWHNESDCGLIMEYLEGTDLGAIPDLTCKDLLSISQQIASALLYLKSRGIIHGDIRPSNIFLCHDRTAKIIDFELSREQFDGKVGYDSRLYPSPEQFEGKQTAESDLFSLGVSLCVLLTGQRFTRKDILLLGKDELKQRLHRATHERSEVLGCESRNCRNPSDCIWSQIVIPGLLDRNPANRCRIAEMLSNGSLCRA